LRQAPDCAPRDPAERNGRMGYGLIGTWKLSLDGVTKAAALLEQGAAVMQGIDAAVTDVEDNPAYNAVGFGGLPNREGMVELDSAYMDGETLNFGGVMGVQNIKNPIRVAMKLSAQKRDFLLCGKGAEAYAQQNGFEFTNMLTPKAREQWLEKKAESEKHAEGTSSAGHDTVCVIGLDAASHMAAGVSTSGLPMKHPGRVGDSPVIGSGIYCDGEIGGAAATGIGEDIMKGCLSFEIVRRMADGASPQEACTSALTSHLKRLEKSGLVSECIAVIAMNRNGDFGAATSLDTFAFTHAAEGEAPSVYFARNRGGVMDTVPATAELLAAYHDE
jgi:isoaspartyl peptidase/L-asparaginase-like protein (Ntn-hydrolase superfamily)